MAVVVVKGKMEILVILVVQEVVVLVVGLLEEHQEVVQLKDLLVAELDMVLPAVMVKQDPHLEEAVVVVLGPLEVQDHQLLEMDLVVSEYKHLLHSGILRVQLVIQELMVVEVPQLLVVIGLLGVVEVVEHHTIHYKVMGALAAAELDMVAEVIGIFHPLFKENKVPVVEAEDFVYLLHMLSPVEMQMAVPASSSSHILHKYSRTLKF